jgi:hypothetical protein
MPGAFIVNRLGFPARGSIPDGQVFQTGRPCLNLFIKGLADKMTASGISIYRHKKMNRQAQGAQFPVSCCASFHQTRQSFFEQRS